MVLHLNDCPQWAALDKFHFISVIKVPVMFFEISIDVPGVPLLRFINERLQKISANAVLGASGVGFRRGQRLRLASFVEEAGHAT